MPVNPFSWITNEKSPLAVMIILVFLVIVAGSLFFSLFMLAGSVIFGIEINSFFGLSRSGQLPDVDITRFIQVSQQLSFFLFPSVLLLLLYRNSESRIKLIQRNVSTFEILMVFVLSFLTIYVTSWTGIINSELNLPEGFLRLEEWMTEKEARASEITGQLLETPDGFNFIINLFIIALIPAVSEELVFRGIIQQVFRRISGSVHWAVWITAVLFSAIHLQFYGFLPRLILGLIFGYLFVWTGNITVPVAAHFFNNILTLTFAFVYGMENIPDGISGRGLQGWAAIPFFQIAAGGLILYYFRKRYKRNIVGDG